MSITLEALLMIDKLLQNDEFRIKLDLLGQSDLNLLL